MVNDLLKYYIDWSNGNKIYHHLLKTLELLFCISIASFIFEKIYFKYTLINITDYKEIAIFFIHGHYFIPLIIFFLVLLSTEILTYILFYLTGYFSSVKSANEIEKYNITKKEIDKDIRLFQRILKKKFETDISKKEIIQFIKELKKELKPDLVKDISKFFSPYKDKLFNIFKFVIKFIIISSIYYYSIPYFQIYVFIPIVLLSLIALYLSFQLYILLEVIPNLYKITHKIAGKYLEETKKEKNLLNH